MTQRLSCLILMPFAPAFDAVHATIENAVHHASGRALRCHRVDQNHAGIWIPAEIMRQIRTADVCIADITDRNANVMWEMGYAMARDTPVIAIAKDGELPFNVSSYRTIFYSLNDLKTTLSGPLELAIRETLERTKTDAEFLGHLRRTLPLADHGNMVARFQQRGSLIVRLFLEHHLARYREALSLAEHEVLPLSSAPRLELATSAIAQAQHNIRAITDLANDQWQKPQSAYLEANRRAAERNVRVRRIVLISESGGRIPQERFDAIAAHREAGALIEYANLEHVRAQFAMSGEDFTPENVLIVDDKLMTRSGISSQDGKIFTSKADIASGIASFDRLWDYVTVAPGSAQNRLERVARTHSRTTRTDVLILGAGAVGVNAAVFLARLGFDVELQDSADTILQGGPRASFINHSDGFEYYKSGHKRTGEYCIDGAFTKSLLCPTRLFATDICDLTNPIRFFVSDGSVQSGQLTLADFMANVDHMRRYFERRYEQLKTSLRWDDAQMERRVSRRPGTFARPLRKEEYADVVNVAGGCTGSGFGINMSHYYAYLLAMLRQLQIPFHASSEPRAIERVNGTYNVSTDHGTIRARHLLLAAGHRNPVLFRLVRAGEMEPPPSGTYYLNAMTFVRLPRTADPLVRARARRINFTLQQEHGAMYACIIAPTPTHDGFAVVYRPTVEGSQLKAQTVYGEHSAAMPPEWDSLISAGLPNDDPHVVETIRRARELYPVLEEAIIDHTVCRPVFNYATADSDHGLDRRVREIPGIPPNVIGDGSVSVWAAPKWTNAELVALMAADHVNLSLRRRNLPRSEESGLGPTKLDVAAISLSLSSEDVMVRRDDALRYAQELGLPSSIVALASDHFE